jgi:pentapeptide repeat protein
MQGVYLSSAHAEGASFDHARLQGAVLSETLLQGASFVDAKLQGASLDKTHLQAASFVEAQVQGASLRGAQLQGADCNKSSMEHADLSNAYIWRAKAATCRSARVSQPNRDAIVELMPITPEFGIRINANQGEIKNFIDRTIANIQSTSLKEKLDKRMRVALLEQTKDEAEFAQFWSECERVTKDHSQEKFNDEHAVFLRNLVCEARTNRKFIANAIVTNWISTSEERRVFSASLAKGVLGQDGKDCMATKDFDESTKDWLRGAIAEAATMTSPGPPSQASPIE